MSSMAGKDDICPKRCNSAAELGEEHLGAQGAPGAIMQEGRVADISFSAILLT